MTIYKEVINAVHLILMTVAATQVHRKKRAFVAWYGGNAVLLDWALNNNNDIYDCQILLKSFHLERNISAWTRTWTNIVEFKWVKYGWSSTPDWEKNWQNERLSL